VLHVFGRVAIDVDRCAEWLKLVALKSQAEGAAGQAAPVVLYDVQAFHAVAVLRARADLPSTLVWSELCLPSLHTDAQTAAALADHTDSDAHVRFGRRLPASACTAGSSADAETEQTPPMLWIGPRSRTLTNFMMHYRSSEFYVFDPADQAAAAAAGPSAAPPAALEPPRGGKLLSRRYYLMQRARDANTVGILAGTLGVKGCIDTMRQLKQICHRAGKKTYTFVMGKLNVPKLANFTEIDVFVLVACPENSLLDAREFYRPVITPFEMQCACVNEAEWVNRYELDFRHVGDHIERSLAAMPTDPSDAEPRFSFIKGAVIHDDDAGASSSADGGSLPLAVLRTSGAVAELPAARFLANRTFGGLEQRIGETAVVDVVEGRSGIAESYAEMDPNLSHTEEPSA
jgi:diphthamide biosynthesis protein 2